ncbi:SMP-30/gluconolactonase/LRE family protein [Sphaerisporangium aureirubrum]|uniref:SMP-30/gluconolactonase/LRE family protein n=1 Tax=Sphaerisporangium aureirubrum TaxID=1544736 RepID=A0ABW1NMT8_9ACTN
MRKRMLALAVAVTAAGITAVTVPPSNAATVTAAPSAATAPARPPASRIAVHFDLAKGQMPENIALGPDGTAYVTFAAARQVAAVGPAGVTRILATLPAPADGGAGTPVLGFALTTGIVRTGDGTLYFLYAGGDAATTGLYRLRPGQEPRRIAALPAAGLPNGLAYDAPSKTFYLTDSVLGTITTVSLDGGRAEVWSKAPELAATTFLGANGIKVRHGAIWVTNLDRGTLLRIPVEHGRPGPVQVRATGLAGIDDFAFTATGGEQVVATLNAPNKVVRVDADGHATTLLTSAAGLQNPTSVAVRGRTLYVLSAAYTTATDPNLMLATLPRH